MTFVLAWALLRSLYAVVDATVDACAAALKSRREMRAYQARLRWTDRCYIDVLGNVCDGSPVVKRAALEFAGFFASVLLPGLILWAITRRPQS